MARAADPTVHPHRAAAHRYRLPPVLAPRLPLISALRRQRAVSALRRRKAGLVHPLVVHRVVPFPLQVVVTELLRRKASGPPRALRLPTSRRGSRLSRATAPHSPATRRPAEPWLPRRDSAEPSARRETP